MSVWIYRDGRGGEFRGSLVECGERWRSAPDKWHGSVVYSSGELTEDEVADEMIRLMVFMEGVGWPEVDVKYAQVRAEMAKLGRACAETMDRELVSFLGTKS